MATCAVCKKFAEGVNLRFVATSACNTDYCSLVQKPHWTKFGTKIFGTVHHPSGSVRLEKTPHLTPQLLPRDVIAMGVFAFDEEDSEFDGVFFADVRSSRLSSE
jgi:hypothetical protein